MKEYWDLRQKYQDAFRQVEELEGEEKDSKEWMEACALRDDLQKQHMRHEMHETPAYNDLIFFFAKKTFLTKQEKRAGEVAEFIQKHLQIVTYYIKELEAKNCHLNDDTKREWREACQLRIELMERAIMEELRGDDTQHNDNMEIVDWP